MRAHNDFIVHIPERYKSTKKTKSGVEIHLDKRFSDKELAHNIHEVVDVPITYKGEIKPGCRLLTDTLLVHNQQYNNYGEQQNMHLVDRKKKLYRVPQSMVVCYSMGAGTKFKGFRDNLLCEKYEPKLKPKEPKKIGSIFVPDMSVDKVQDTPVVKVFIGNDELKNIGVDVGDLVYHKKHVAIDVNLNGKKYLWLLNRHLDGKLLKKAV